jgi:hypothetical protein
MGDHKVEPLATQELEDVALMMRTRRIRREEVTRDGVMPES